ncbi:hypothetical protein HY78_30700 (plasmid) [Rhizorhabdus wittichii DC-6]|nr:hypothetical protein HY78_30700 [Rhizorhabdus wittichii DC-6]
MGAGSLFLPSTFEVLQASEQGLQKGMIALAGQEQRQLALQERAELATCGRILFDVVEDECAEHDALAGFGLATFDRDAGLKRLSPLAQLALILAHFLKALFNGCPCHAVLLVSSL